MFQVKTYEVHDYLYVPKLDGSESFTQISGTTTVNNGVMSGGSGYIYPFPNTTDWELSFKALSSGVNCALVLIKVGTNARGKDILQIITDVNRYAQGYAYVGTSQTASTSRFATVSLNEWHDYIIKKQNGSITLQVDNSTPVNISWSLISSLDELGIGVDTWTSSSMSIKEIFLKPL